DQCCEWVPGANKSPDRVDALVWAISQLILIANNNERTYEPFLEISFSSGERFGSDLYGDTPSRVR
ncbi:MAG TPA: hypothetical protein VFD03_09280, partial [Clostridia bacterium]|nr:hypothetical protein [Clostridia bacterium]